MKRQSGFTLIELVVVIVILGILAATAAPKFMNLQGDARISALNGLKGAVKSAVSMTYSKAILKGIEKSATGEVCANGSDLNGATCSDPINIVYGRPDATAAGLIKSMDIESKAVESSGDANDTSVEWNYFVSDDGKSIVIFSSSGGLKPKDQKTNEGCNLVYTKASKEDGSDEIVAPKVTLYSDKC